MTENEKTKSDLFSVFARVEITGSYFARGEFETAIVIQPDSVIVMTDARCGGCGLPLDECNQLTHSRNRP